jgi:hypothetical protein
MKNIGSSFKKSKHKKELRSSKMTEEFISFRFLSNVPKGVHSLACKQVGLVLVGNVLDFGKILAACNEFSLAVKLKSLVFEVLFSKLVFESVPYILIDLHHCCGIFDNQGDEESVLCL